jgi:GAF domain-containing protein
MEHPRPQTKATSDAERSRTLLEINNAVISDLARDALFHAIARVLRAVVPFDRIAMFLHDPRKNVLRLSLLESSLPVGRYAVGLEWAPGESHAGWAFQHQQTLLRRDLETERHFPTEDLLLADGVRSFVVAPLIARGKTVSFVGREGIALFRTLKSRDVVLSNCSRFVQEQLKA